MASGKVSDAFTSAGANFAHLLTFGGNPPAAAAAHANLDIMEAEDMAGRSERMGAYLFEALHRLHDHAIVGQIRGGLGLLAAIEIVKDKATRERFPQSAGVDKLAVSAMRENHMLGRAGNVIPLAPPLCISRDEIDDAVDRLDRVLTRLEETL